MATIKDVARLAGVSISTASRALSEKIFVEPETKKRVLQAVADLNYRPNYLAKGLKEGKTGILALIIPDVGNMYYPQMIKYFEKHVAQNGYTLMLFNTNEDVEQEKKAIESIKKWYADGVIVLASTSEVAHFLSLNNDRIPMVLVNRVTSEDVSCVSIDHEAGAYDMMKYLISEGHSKISVVFRGFDNAIYRLRYEGTVRALREAGLGDTEKYFVFNANNTQDAHDKVSAMLAMKDRPTVFLTMNDMLAFGVYSAAYQLGLRIPEDISIAGFDDLSVSAHMLPPLTTYNHRPDAICEAAARCLIRQIDSAQPVHEKIIIRGEIKIRKSVKALIPAQRQ